jgi:hypothetical protein
MKVTSIREVQEICASRHGSPSRNLQMPHVCDVQSLTFTVYQLDYVSIVSVLRSERFYFQQVSSLSTVAV